MRNRRAGAAGLATLLAVVLAAAAGGCGVPGSGQPRAVGTAPKLGARDDGTATVIPQHPDRANDAGHLVQLYLQAVAGGNDVNQDRPNAKTDSIDRVREFLTPDAAAEWKPLEKINVVQVKVDLPTPVPGSSTLQQVQVTYHRVGELTDKGAIERLEPSVPVQHTFNVLRVNGALRIVNPPDGMLLSTEGLALLYDARPIYFWDTLERTLVSDLRYMPKSVGMEKRPNAVMGWLLHGPSEWLRLAVKPLPEAVGQRGRVDPGGERDDSPVKVNLAAEASSLEPDKLKRLLIQLQWSFGDRSRPVQLLIEGKPKEIAVSVGDLDAANRAMPLSDRPAKYCVVGGSVYRAGGGVAPAVLSTDVNSRVVTAAVSAPQGRAVQSVALVRAIGDGVQLWLGPAESAVADSMRVGLTATTMGRPIWLTEPSPRVLVVADGDLLEVPLNGSPSALNAPPKVTAAAVALDGRRLALVAGGQVYAASLQFDGDRVQMGAVRQVASGLTEVAGVAWSREDRLVVGGRAGGVAALSEITVDGALVTPMDLAHLAPLRITQVVAYPAEPTRQNVPGDIMIEATGLAYQVYSKSVEPLDGCGPAPAGGQAPPVTAPFHADGRPTP